MEGLKRGGAAIVGVAESDLGQVADGLSVIDLMVQGTGRALDDCGLSLKDVDGLFSATTQSRLSVLALAEYLAINPSFLGSTIVGGSSFEYHVAHAMGAIALGLCNVAVIAYGSTQRSVGRRESVTGPGAVERQIAESGDAIDGGHGQRAAQGGAAGIRADGRRDI